MYVIEAGVYGALLGGCFFLMPLSRLPLYAFLCKRVCVCVCGNENAKLCKCAKFSLLFLILI